MPGPFRDPSPQHPPQGSGRARYGDNRAGQGHPHSQFLLGVERNERYVRAHSDPHGDAVDRKPPHRARQPSAASPGVPRRSPGAASGRHDGEGGRDPHECHQRGQHQSRPPSEVSGRYRQGQPGGQRPDLDPGLLDPRYPTAGSRRNVLHDDVVGRRVGSRGGQRGYPGEGQQGPEVPGESHGQQPEEDEQQHQHLGVAAAQAVGQHPERDAGEHHGEGVEGGDRADLGPGQT